MTSMGTSKLAIRGNFKTGQRGEPKPGYRMVAEPTEEYHRHSDPDRKTLPLDRSTPTPIGMVHSTKNL
jgi:hypothetical protein